MRRTKLILGTIAAILCLIAAGTAGLGKIGKNKIASSTYRDNEYADFYDD